MEINDFRYMRRGKTIKTLTPDDAQVLLPIDQRGPLKKRALLLLHGFSSSPAVYREMMPTLPKYDAIVCPVLPGHADSLMAFSNVRAVDWLTAAETACQALIDAYDEVDVLGLSLGGLLACHLSTRYPLHHLYLLAPALALRSSLRKMLCYGYILRGLGFTWLRNSAGDLHTNRSSELGYRLLPVRTVMELLRLIKDFPFIPPKCPTDLFLGKFDAVVHSEAVAQRFANQTTTQIHWLANSAHVLPLDGDVDTIISCIKSQNK